MVATEELGDESGVAWEFECWAGSDVGLVRYSNQDWAGCFPHLGLAIVADGMGGHSFGEVASRRASQVIRDYLAPRTVKPAAPLRGQRGASARRREELAAAVRAANAEIYHASVGPHSAPGSMGTTVVALWAPPGERHLAWSHVGDSRLYRFRDGEIELLTADHTKPGRRYWNADSVPLDVPHTNVLARALGIQPEVAPSSGSARIALRDTYLLCSDGVSGVLAGRALRDALASSRDLETVGKHLLRSAVRAGGPDNASVALVRFARRRPRSPRSGVTPLPTKLT